MYVQWLLEFVWRIFIQGPLLLINFFTKDNVISDITTNIGFNNKFNYGFLSSLINVSIFFAIALVIFIIIFLFKLVKVMISSNYYLTKYEFSNVLKEFAKAIFITLTFVLFFQLAFTIIDSFIDIFNDVYDKAISQSKTNDISNLLGINSNSSSNNEFKINSIPSRIYEIITNKELDDKNIDNFLFPEVDFLKAADSMNFMFSIIFVNVFAWFLIWILWSIYQKMFEIFFLYLTFPVSVAFSDTLQKINWQIWIKEIINKLVLIFTLLIFLRLYLYAFLLTDKALQEALKLSDNSKDRLYISLISVLAIGFFMVFVTKFIANRNKESIGVYGSIASINQTRNFITNNRNYQTNQNIVYEQSNVDIEQLKSFIRRNSNSNQIDFNSLNKVKVFNK